MSLWVYSLPAEESTNMLASYTVVGHAKSYGLLCRRGHCASDVTLLFTGRHSNGRSNRAGFLFAYGILGRDGDLSGRET